MYDELLKFAVQLAKAAGGIQLAYFRGDRLSIETKSNYSGLRPSSPKKELRGSIRRFRTARRKPPSETNAKPRSSSAARSSSRNA